MTPTTALWLLVVTLVLGVLGIINLSRGRSQEQIARRRALLTLRSERVPPWRRGANAEVLRTPFGRSVDERLRRAGHEEVLAGDAVLSVLCVGGLILLGALQLVAAGAAVVLVVVWLVSANAYLDRLVRKRADRFADPLPDIARVMSHAAGAGMAIPNALALTAREMEEPARTLLGDAVRRLEVGQSLAGAMEELALRAPSREMAVLVSTLVIQQRAGGDVIEALREMSVNLERRRDLRREVETTMAGVRFTAFAVMGLGVAILFVIETISAGTLRRMTEQTAGQIILLIAAGLYAAGYAAMRRLSKVEV